jgi:Protein of unknown function, DUF547
MRHWSMARESSVRLRLTLVSAAVVLFLSSQPISARTDPIGDFFRIAAANLARPVDHSAWNRLLKTYVRPSPDGLNRVNYAALKRQGLEPLRAYIRDLEQVDYRALDKAEQFAFLANLYNAKTVEIVAERYPVKSIKDIRLGGDGFAWFTGGPWKAKVLTVGGMQLSLDDIEHRILRPIFKDPRVHYAVNCASIGCPNLGTEAFTGAKLNAQLEAAARAYVNSRRGVAAERGRVVVSSIFIWYKADFGGTDQGVLEHLRQYASSPLARQLAKVSSIDDHRYDWGLNDTTE